MDAKLKYLLTFLAVILSIIGCDVNENRIFDSADKVWPKLKMENKPGTYWWWMGSAVDKKNIFYILSIFILKRSACDLYLCINLRFAIICVIA